MAIKTGRLVIMRSPIESFRAGFSFRELFGVAFAEGRAPALRVLRPFETVGFECFADVPPACAALLVRAAPETIVPDLVIGLPSGN